jgi:orotate phosphoribosyltransferase
VRKQAKNHGTQQLIEGAVRPGMRVALLEDVITTGGSTLAAVAALEEVGAQVVGVVVLVDRLEGGLESLHRKGLEALALYTRHDFIEEDPRLSSTLTDTNIE